MDDVDPGNAAASPMRAGEALRAARDALGLTLGDVGARTRIPTRHLEAIESGDYTSLPSTTYAIGFARAYARAVGADEVEVARDVRAEVARLGRRQPEYTPYEIADQSRVPSRGAAIVAAGVALAVLVLVGLFYGTDLFRAGTSLSAPSRVIEDDRALGRVGPSVAIPTARPAGGQVTLAATDEVWLRVYDADGKTLRQGTMKAGERYDVPGDAKEPMINVGRPDKLAVTLNGSAIPPLGDGSRAIKDVRVSASAIAARLSGAPPVVAPSTPAPAAVPVDTPVRRLAVPIAVAPRAAGASEQRETRGAARPRPAATRDAPENILPSGFATGRSTP